MTADVGPTRVPASGPSFARDSVRLKWTARGCVDERPRHPKRGSDTAMIRDMRPTEDLRRADSCLAEPHKRLMAAVLQTVVDDCRGSVYRRARGDRTPIARRGLRKATAYLASTDRRWAFSFENLCEALDLDAGRLRRELRTIPVFALPEVGIPLG